MKKVLTLGLLVSLPFLVSACGGSANADEPTQNCKPPIMEPIGKNDHLVTSDKVREIIELEIKKCEMLVQQGDCSLVITSILGVPAFTVGTPQSVILSEDMFYPKEKERLDRVLAKYGKLIEEGAKPPFYLEKDE